jgi:hypothetical protein
MCAARRPTPPTSPPPPPAPPAKTVNVHELGRLLRLLAGNGDKEWLTDLTRLVKHRVALVLPRE